MNLSYRQKKIISECLRQNEPVSVQSMMNAVQIKEKTLRKEIGAINLFLSEMNAELVLHKRKGYVLVADDALRYQLIHQFKVFQKRTIQEDEKQHQVMQIVRHLMSFPYTKMEQLEELLHLNRSSFVEQMKEARKKLAYFQIKVETRPYYGMYLVGKEKDFRFVLLELSRFFDENSNTETGEELVTILNRYQLKLKDNEFLNLKDLLAITKSRIQQGLFCENEFESFDSTLSAVQVAEELLSATKRESEVMWLASILLSGLQPCKEIIRQIPSNYYHMSREIARQVFRELKKVRLSFQEDEHFEAQLADTLIPILVRTQRQIRISQSLTVMDQKLNDSPFSMSVATKIQEILENLNVEIQQADVYQLAILVYNTIIPRHYRFEPLKIIIASTLGIHGAASLQYRLMNRYRHYIHSIEVVSFYELESMDLSRFDVLLYYETEAFDVHRYSIAALPIHYFIDMNDYSDLFEQMITPRFQLTSPFASMPLRRNVSTATDEAQLKQEIQQFYHLDRDKMAVCLHQKVGIVCVITAQEKEALWLHCATGIWVQGKKMTDCLVLPCCCHDDLLQMKMAEHVSRLILFQPKAQQALFSSKQELDFKPLIHERSRFLE